MQIYDPLKLLESLLALPRETAWVEFKHNNANAESIGKYVSSLANSAMLEEKDAAYLVFGVRDTDHEVVGTIVDLVGETVGNEDLLFWLSKQLEPRVTIKPITVDYFGRRVEILCIDPAYRQPIKFKKEAYVRIESNQQPLSNFPERERTLWQITSRYSFETSSLRVHLPIENILQDFDIRTLLSAMGYQNDDIGAQVQKLIDLKLIVGDMQGNFEISALLALTAARNLNQFSLLENKGARVIVYKRKDKLDAVDDLEGKRGYLVGFPALLKHVMSHIPSEEKMLHGVRKRIFKIPEEALREFIANALVHQDFTESGSRPVIEIFKDRVQITNPGEPLVSVDRFIDSPSKTRNPRFARMMREAGYCEERGSGVDRAIRAIERDALPPPLIEAVEGSTVVSVFMPRMFADMTKDERIRACFQHACLSYERGEPMSNASLRDRFGLSDRQYPQVSAVIKDAVEAGRIKPQNADQGNRNARYIPFYVM